MPIGTTLGAGAIALGLGGMLGGMANAQNSFNNLDSYNESIQSSGESSWNSAESWSKTLGSEASAKDILRAEEANALQDYFLEKQMAYNAKEAQLNREFQALMSNTSYQRAKLDMMKAGFNPILMVNQGGASTPTGATATSGMQTAYKAQTYADQESKSWSKGASSGGSSAKSWGKTTSNSQATTQLRDVLGSIVKSAQIYAPSSAKGFETPDKTLD